MFTQSQPSDTKMNWPGLSSSMQRCIQNCINCFQICSYMIDHCLSKGGVHSDSKHIKLLNDCAKICTLSADFMIRQSDYHGATCRTCAEICLACAESCEATGSDDPMMKSCAEACRECAASCSEMAEMQ